MWSVVFDDDSCTFIGKWSVGIHLMKGLEERYHDKVNAYWKIALLGEIGTGIDQWSVIDRVTD